MKFIKMGNVLTITYIWLEHYDHGVCGHTYEVIEYFYILRKHIPTKILLVVSFDLDYFRRIIESKYDFSKEEVDEIIENTTLIYKPIPVISFKPLETQIFSNLVLVTNGFYEGQQSPFVCKKIVCFPCYNKYVNLLNIPNLIILQDDRIYPKSANSIHYVKKILLDKIKKPTMSKNRTLIYATTGPRAIDIRKYPSEEIICVTDDKKIEGYKYLDIPVDNVFNEFNKYLYTPVSSKFDCSPRFIVECKYFNKEVEYDIDYNDIGLETRKYDIENNFESLFLREDDFIVKFMEKMFEA